MGRRQRSIRTTQTRRRLLAVEHLETRQLLAADWHNPLLSVDVNEDGHVQALDALLVINAVNRHQDGVLSPGGVEALVDVNANGRVEPLDALLVINAVNRNETSAATIDLRLAQDTGSSNQDLITRDGTVIGQLRLDPGQTLERIRYRINRGPVVELAVDAEARFSIAPDPGQVAPDGKVRLAVLAESGGRPALSVLEYLWYHPAPAVTWNNLPEGQERSTHLQTVQIAFSAPLDTTTVILDRFTLHREGESIAPLSVRWERGGRAVLIDYPALAQGNYAFTANLNGLRDLAGNVVSDTEPLSRRFTVGAYDAVWIGRVSGDWHDPANWDSGRVPSAGDSVLIGVPDITVTHRTGETQIDSLLSRANLTLSGGVLGVLQTLQVDAQLTMDGGTLFHATIVKGEGVLPVQFSPNASTFDSVTTAVDLDLRDESYLSVRNGIVLRDATIFLGYDPSKLSKLYFENSGVLGGRGEIRFGDGDGLMEIGAKEPITLIIEREITVYGQVGRIIGLCATVINRGTFIARETVDPGGIAYDPFDSGNHLGTEHGWPSSRVNPMLGTQRPRVDRSLRLLERNQRVDYEFTGLQPLVPLTLRLYLGGASQSLDIHINGELARDNLSFSDDVAPFDLAVTTDGSGTLSLSLTDLEGGGLAALELRDGDRVLHVIDAGRRPRTSIEVQDWINEGEVEVRHGNDLRFQVERAVIGKMRITGGRVLIDATYRRGRYRLDQEVTVAEGGYLRLGGNWTVDPDVTLTAVASSLWLGSSWQSWFNNGNIIARRSEVVLAGEMSTASLGSLELENSEVWLRGNFDNQGNVLRLDAQMGSWRIDGGRISGGEVEATGENQLIIDTHGYRDFMWQGARGTLKDVTLRSDVLVRNQAVLAIEGTVTLQHATITLGDTLGSAGIVDVEGPSRIAKIDGIGTILAIRAQFSSHVAMDELLEIGPEIELRGRSTYFLYPVLLRGSIRSDGYLGERTFAIDEGFTDESTTKRAARQLSWPPGPAPHIEARHEPLAGDALLYNTYRYAAEPGGEFAYTLAGLTPGVLYRVRLHFAELEYNSAGRRIFSVTAGDHVLLKDFDIYTAAEGAERAVVREFEVPANAAGQIVVRFSSDPQSQAQINAIEVLKDGQRVVAVDAGNVHYAGGMHVLLQANEGSLAVSNGQSLQVFYNQPGRVGEVSLEGAGSQLELSGELLIDRDFDVPPQASLTLRGAWTLAEGSRIRANRATLGLGGSHQGKENLTWQNHGVIEAMDTTLILGGRFTPASLVQLVRRGGTVELSGTFDLTGHEWTFGADGTEWMLTGEIVGGRLRLTDGRGLVFPSEDLYRSGKLTDVTLIGTWTVPAGKSATVRGTLVLEAATLNINGRLGVEGDTARIAGEGQLNVTGFVSGNKTILSVLPDVTIAGRGWLHSKQLINHGAIRATDQGLGIYASTVNHGTLAAEDGAELTVHGVLTNAGVISLMRRGKAVAAGGYIQEVAGRLSLDLSSYGSSGTSSLFVDDPQLVLAGTLELVHSGQLPAVGLQLVVIGQPLGRPFLETRFDTVISEEAEYQLRYWSNEVTVTRQG